MFQLCKIRISKSTSIKNKERPILPCSVWLTKSENHCYDSGIGVLPSNYWITITNSWFILNFTERKILKLKWKKGSVRAIFHSPKTEVKNRAHPFTGGWIYSVCSYMLGISSWRNLVFIDETLLIARSAQVNARCLSLLTAN